MKNVLLIALMLMGWGALSSPVKSNVAGESIQRMDGLSTRDYIQDGLIAILDDTRGFRKQHVQLPALGGSWAVEICMTFDSWRTSNNGSYFTPTPWVNNICEIYEYPIGSHNINLKTSIGQWQLSQVQQKGFQTLGAFSNGSNNSSGIFLNGRIIATQNASRPVAVEKRYMVTQVQPTGCIYSCRIYSRALTSAEIAHNYEIDRIRFNLP